MITNKQKLILFSKFGIPDKELQNEDITLIESYFTPAEWIDYIDELKNIMLDRLDDYGKIITKLNTDQATSYLLLVADRYHKAEAILKALNLYSF